MARKKAMSQVREIRTTLRSKSFERYAQLLGRLLRDHRWDALSPLASALRQRDWMGVYLAADSLSSQQYDGATEHFVANQFALLIKKYPFPKGTLPFDPKRNAIDTFRAAERRCARINRKFILLRTNPVRDRFRKETIRARQFIYRTIGAEPCIASVLEKCDFGPGASIDVHGDATSYLAKLMAERWTVTPEAIDLSVAAVLANHHLLEQNCPKSPDGRYTCYDLEHAERNVRRKLKIVDHNKISFVPKTAKTERTIAVEPLLNGFVQKGFDLVLREKLKLIGIDLADQSRNQRMAREGSYDEEDGYVTIDMKSASDSLSQGIVSTLLPSAWHKALSCVRSPGYTLNGRRDDYHKYVSMGNGFCFPLETLVFASACFAAGARRPGRDFSVYGDDIIVRKSVAQKVICLLRHWGFRTNTDKTFLEGPFRESCGEDWFGGNSVRPMTLDYDFGSVESIIKFLNIQRHRERTKVFFSTTRELVFSWLPESHAFRRPPLGGTDDGAVDSEWDEFMTCSHARFKNGHWSWSELAAVPVRDGKSLEAAASTGSYLMSVSLRGAKSVPSGRFSFLPDVTLRRKTKTRVVRKRYSSGSNWTPGSPRGL